MTTSSAGVTYTTAGLTTISDVKVLSGDTDKSAYFTRTITDNSVNLVKSGNISAGEFTVTITDCDSQSVSADLTLKVPMTAYISGNLSQNSNRQITIYNASCIPTVTANSDGLTISSITQSSCVVRAASDLEPGTYTVTITDDVQSVTVVVTVVYPSLSVSTTAGTCTRGGNLTVSVANAVGAISATVTTTEAQSYVTTTVDDTNDTVTIDIADDLPDTVESFTVQYTDSRNNATTTGGNGYRQYYLQD